MSATINILIEELKYVSVNEGARKPISTYAEKLKSGPNPCGKCAQSECQLQAALDELNSVKLITNTLHEEIKLLTQSSYEVSNDINSWTIAQPSRSTTSRTSKTTHTSPGLVNDNSMQPSRLRPKNNNRNGKGWQWKKSSTTNNLNYHPRSDRTTLTY